MPCMAGPDTLSGHEKSAGLKFSSMKTWFFHLKELMLGEEISKETVTVYYSYDRNKSSHMEHSSLFRTLMGVEPGQRRIHKGYIWWENFVKSNAIKSGSTIFIK